MEHVLVFVMIQSLLEQNSAMTATTSMGMAAMLIAQSEITMAA